MSLCFFLLGVATLLPHLPKIELEFHQLLYEAGVRIDNRPALPAYVQGCIQRDLVLHHQVGADAWSAAGDASPAVDKYGSTLFDGVFDEHGRLHEMTAQILPWNIVHMQHLVLENSFKCWFYSSEGLENMSDTILF